MDPSRTYSCKICGYTSNFAKNIAECEKRGRRNFYDMGWTVSFMRDHSRKEGVVVRVGFTPQRHKPIYGVSIDGNEISVLEENILEGFPPPPTAA